MQLRHDENTRCGKARSNSPLLDQVLIPGLQRSDAGTGRHYESPTAIDIVQRDRCVMHGRQLRCSGHWLGDHYRLYRKLDLSHGTLAQIEIVYADFAECHAVPR
ncbi:hypothetical protein D3C78_1108710 [compost metagenome]